MFFDKDSKKNDIDIDDVKDKKTASVYLNKIISETFNSMRIELISMLKKENVPEQEYDQFMKELYHKIQLAAIERYKNILHKEINQSTRLFSS